MLKQMKTHIIPLATVKHNELGSFEWTLLCFVMFFGTRSWRLLWARSCLWLSEAESKSFFVLVVLPRPSKWLNAPADNQLKFNAEKFLFKQRSSSSFSGRELKEAGRETSWWRHRQIRW